MKKIIEMIINEMGKGQGVYLVGGYIRDLILGRQTQDFDFAVAKNVLGLVHRISGKTGAKAIVLDDVNRIYRIVLKDKDNPVTLDFSHIFGKDIISDLARRDFSINAMAFELTEKNVPDIFSMEKILKGLIDPFNGFEALNSKSIEIISEKNLLDDPLRIIRAFRLSAQLGFKISQHTLKFIKKHSSQIRKPAAERIHDELVKIFECSCTVEVIDAMDKAKVLEYIFPEIKDMKRSSRKYYFHPDGLWQHAKLSLAKLQDILDNPGIYFDTSASPIDKLRLKVKAEPLNITHRIRMIKPGKDDLINRALGLIKDRVPVLKFITLFHDVGKPKTVKRINNRVRFFEHEHKGSIMIKNMMARLKFSRKEIMTGEKLVKYHMRPGSLNTSAVPSEKSLFRFFRDMDQITIDLLLLALADRSSYAGVTTTFGKLAPYRLFNTKLIEWYLKYLEMINMPRLLNGNDIMKTFKLTPGKWIGDLLKRAESEQLAGRIHSREEALKSAEKFLPKVRKKYKLHPLNLPSRVLPVARHELLFVAQRPPRGED